MLTRTTETALMALLYLASRGDGEPVSPRHVASEIGLSASYLAKIFTLLAKAGILRAHRGAHGGVTLSRPSPKITLLDILTAFQGQRLESPEPGDAAAPMECSFHRAVSEIHESVRGVLTHWTLADLVAEPCPHLALEDAATCRMAVICPKRREAWPPECGTPRRPPEDKS